MTEVAIHAILDRHRISAGLTTAECWDAYFAMGGRNDLTAVNAFFNGTGTIPQSEIDILAAAIRDHPWTNQDSPGLAISGPPVVIELMDAGFMSDTSPQLMQLLQGLNVDATLLGSISILGVGSGPGEGGHPDSSQPWHPLLLGESSIVMGLVQVSSAQPGSTPADSLALGSGSLLRVDSATTRDWELHSTGDELLVLLSGEAEVAVDRAASSRAVLQEPYQACIIPRGRWHRHTATQDHTRLLYVTPLDDTRTLVSNP